jgi:hypothetical protein
MWFSHGDHVTMVYMYIYIDVERCCTLGKESWMLYDLCCPFGGWWGVLTRKAKCFNQLLWSAFNMLKQHKKWWLRLPRPFKMGPWTMKGGLTQQRNISRTMDVKATIICFLSRNKKKMWIHKRAMYPLSSNMTMRDPHYITGGLSPGWTTKL